MKPMIDTLKERYSEPQRHYHTMQHIYECLAEFKEVRSLSLLGDHKAVELAIWWHDAIYDPKKFDNEIKSAELAKESLAFEKTGRGEEQVQKVCDMILATSHSGTIPEDHETRYFLDIDLAILGSSEERFAEYEEQIKKEFSWVPSFLFNKKRKEILKGFLDRPSIYYTDYFQKKYEEKARANLDKSLK